MATGKIRDEGAAAFPDGPRLRNGSAGSGNTAHGGKTIASALENIDRHITEWEQRHPVPFEDFLQVLVERPERVLRNIFQVFHDLVQNYVAEGKDEYPDDPETIHFVYYDCTRLFVEGTDQPFFADRLFANRLVNLVEALRRGAQQNKIYIFEGPHGCGKSTFLNILLEKFERFVNTEKGARYETVWRLNRGAITGGRSGPSLQERLTNLLQHSPQLLDEVLRALDGPLEEDGTIEVPCPSHDNPVLVVPKSHRRAFLDDLFRDHPFREELFSRKEYEWVFRASACTICSSLYGALLGRLQSPREVFRLLYARPYLFNRRLGEGVSVFSPGDKPTKQVVLTNEMLQSRLDEMLGDSRLVRFLFSRFAKTNNGIYALMDIKSHNAERLIELHNIISEGVHKVEDIEENVSSLFLATMNPEDRASIQDFPSFSDRIEFIKIPYVLDLTTEVEIYRNVFGRNIDHSFLPRVLHNFARVIISTRLSLQSEALLDWIREPDKYSLYCDDNLQLLKMEIYTGNIPKWLEEEDRRRLTARRRRRIIAESEAEGEFGFSGRDSLKIFNQFYSTYARPDKLITMAVVYNFFTKVQKELGDTVPPGFLDSLVRMYDYTVLQEVKESLYYYNEERISRDIQNYLFAVNFEPGAVQTCAYTGERLEITEEFLRGIELRLLGADVLLPQRLTFRRQVQKEYTADTLTREIMAEGRAITETRLFAQMHERYVHNLKEKALDPFLDNENFRRAIKDYDNKEAFKTYDKKIRADVAFLMNNLIKNFHYTRQGAKDMCIYVIDSNLARKFTHA
ncbi:MAG: serine protein kinase PrkA [Desulfuromonadales bacterium]|nr:serine protein kinase PrkA [Desulfuromonadales bacterium]